MRGARGQERNGAAAGREGLAVDLQRGRPQRKT